jgi:hypothetical protein
MNGGKCLSCKAVHIWVKKFPHSRLKLQVMPDQLRKGLRQQLKNFYGTCFNTLVK